MQQTQNMKYQCGCGKSYSSYPAFSTHKKLKHNNKNPIGTVLPKQFNPKRGRPSFTVPHRQKNSVIVFYSALTVVEVGLLKLQQKYMKVMSDAEVDADLSLLNSYSQCEKLISNQSGTKLIEAIKRFNQFLITHLNQQLSAPITLYLRDLSIHLLQNLQNKEIQLNWEQNSIQEIIQPSSFNKFYQKKANLQRVKEFAKLLNKNIQFLFELTALLSQWLTKLGLCSGTLSMKSRQ